MAISKFIIPAGGLTVTGSTILSGTVVVTDNVSVTQLTASDHVSASNGYFANLDVAQLTAPSLNLAGDLIVSGNTTLGYDVGEDVVAVKAQLTASAGLEVSGGDLKVLAGALSASSTLQAGGEATLAGGLTVSGAPLDASAVAVSASQLSSSGDSWIGGTLNVGTDLIVAGDLTVNGALTYLNTQNLQVSDSKVVIAYGSPTGLDAGIYVASDSSPLAKFYFDGSNSWLADKSVKVTGDLSASATVVAPVVTGSTTTGSFAKFGDITGSYVSGINASFTSLSGSLSSSLIQASSITAKYYGSHPTNIVTIGGGAGTAVLLDSFTLLQARAAKYVFAAKEATTGKVHAIEALVAGDATSVSHVPYASVYTSASPLVAVSSSWTATAGGTVQVYLVNQGTNALTSSCFIQYVNNP